LSRGHGTVLAGPQRDDPVVIRWFTLGRTMARATGLDAIVELVVP
jgi:hypothetical protein